jgi:hypothetical protein
MDREYIKDHQVIERYLQDKLSTDEQAAFEELYLSSPDLLDELEAAQSLQQGLQDLAVLEKADQAEKRNPWLASVFNSPQYAMAASVLLIVSLAVTGTLYQRIDQQGIEDPGYSLMTTQIQPLISTRATPGSEQVNKLHLGNTPQQFVLMVDPGFSSYSHYRTSVYLEQNGDRQTTIWQGDRMLPGYEDMLAVSLPSSILKEGVYVVEVEGWRNDWPAGHDFEPVETLTFEVIDNR